VGLGVSQSQLESGCAEWGSADDRLPESNLAARLFGGYSLLVLAK
jgi:hypothetical protein